MKKLLEKYGISYLGNVSQSMKLRLSEEHGVLTYGIYLAPANLSGYEVCPVSKFCREHCLNGSGNNKVEKLGGKNRIEQSRIKKTRMFFENREDFMRIVIWEIQKAQRKAQRMNLGFAVRLNCTSDISPEDFVLDGKCILEIFPNIQFYDYTKVPKRFALLRKYHNYDLTYSYNGHNKCVCEKILKDGGRVAVVFSRLKPMPQTLWGYNVFNANGYDMRFMDGNGIAGLTYHPVANDYKSGKFVEPKTAFIV